MLALWCPNQPGSRIVFYITDIKVNMKHFSPVHFRDAVVGISYLNIDVWLDPHKTLLYSFWHKILLLWHLYSF